MRKNGFLLTMAMLAFALNACGGRASASAAPLSAEEIISGAYTAVALTGMAQLQITQTAIDTPTPDPTATPSIAVTPTASPLAHPVENPYLTPQPPTPTVFLPLQSASDAGQNSAEDSTPCNGAAYLDDVNIPDGTVFAPGETFTKTWKIKNTGSCAWNRSYAIAFSGGDDLSGTTTTLRRALPPNGAGNVSVELTAPGTEGTYTSYWIMTDGSGAPFGNVFYVQIVVKSDGSAEDE